MAPKRTESPPKGDGSPPNGEEIPTGWSVKLEVEKDGTITTTYYCPDTGQEFYTYPSLIRYVDYAKKNKIGIYGPVFKSIRKWEIDALKKQNPIGHRKTTTALSIPGRPSLPNSDSLAADQEHYVSILDNSLSAITLFFKINQKTGNRCAEEAQSHWS
ncbi:hypothetical protein L195_g012284 [Trifolium pratense]|uniref:MBD domain-containing protein n=1 Tax=Trifolium pratense TaxID=57577 RepID=A0A2K3PJZ8_TRIPR|nr:hypothetical protein L195_g012284 [Trifolium pratense]